MSEAEIRKFQGRGLGLPEARELRIRVEDERLVLHRSGAPTRVVSTVASLTRIAWLPPEESLRLLGSRARRLEAKMPRGLLTSGFGRRARGSGGGGLFEGMPDDVDSAAGALVFYEGDRPVLALELHPFVPAGTTQTEYRETSGANRVARALGLVIEPAEATATLNRSTLQSVLVKDENPPDHGWVLLLIVLCLLSAVAGFLAWPLTPRLPFWLEPTPLDWVDEVRAALALLSVLLLAPVLVGLVRARRRFFALVSAPPDPGPRTVVPLPPSYGDLHSQFQIDERDVVVVDVAGVEFWLPGPALGGVTHAEVGDGTLVWRDSAGRRLWYGLEVYLNEEPATRDGLGAACAAAGIKFTDMTPLPVSGGVLPYNLIYDEEWRHPFAQLGWETGQVNYLISFLAMVATLVLLPAAIGAAVNGPVWGWLALIGAVGCAVARFWTGFSYRRWRKHIIKQQRPAQKELHE